MNGICSVKKNALSYEPIFNLMRDRKGVIPDDLVKYIYLRSPGEAMLGYMRYSSTANGWSSEQKELLLAEHEIGNTLWKHQHGLLEPSKVEPVAAVELEKLSHNKNWWARLYVAEIMRQHPGFRNTAIVEQLKKDENRLVREAVVFDKKEDTVSTPAK